GEYKKMEYLESVVEDDNNRSGRVLLEYDIPLSEILVDFHDKLKSGTQGYASMDYSMIDNRPADLVKLDVLVNH
ncbi:MAG: elongation factor 4, partial [Chloroflexota bacterium]